MTASRVRLVAAAWAIAMAVLLASASVLVVSKYGTLRPEEATWTFLFGAGYATVGAVLMARRPEERIGLLAALIGLSGIAALACRAVATVLDTMPGDPPPVTAVIALLSGTLQSLAIFGGGGPLLVRFPDGRVPRLGRLVDAVLVLIVGLQVLQALVPGYIRVWWLEPIRNPIGVPVLGGGAIDGVANLAFVAYGFSAALAVLVVIRRYRRSGAVVRAQIRWVAAAAIGQSSLFALMLLGVDWLWGPWVVSICLVPFAIGVAILRYRLFEIDRIIGRTLAYAVVTALLAGVFIASNLVLQAGLVGITGEGDTLIVAASTLLVASLFQPIRRRVQGVVDRRFNRAHLDAERVVATFAGQLRDQVDLDRLRSAVVVAVDDSVAPSDTSLWLRGVR